MSAAVLLTAEVSCSLISEESWEVHKYVSETKNIMKMIDKSWGVDEHLVEMKCHIINFNFDVRNPVVRHPKKNKKQKQNETMNRTINNYIYSLYTNMWTFWAVAGMTAKLWEKLKS